MINNERARKGTYEHRERPVFHYSWLATHSTKLSTFYGLDLFIDKNSWENTV